MAEKAHVTSVEAIETFRATLINYVSKARPAVEEVTADALRTKLWLENNQRLHWEGQLRQRAKLLERVQGELSSARLSSLPTEQATKINAVRKAKQAVEEAEAKLRLVKQWSREIDHRLDPITRQLEKLHAQLAYDMPQATAYLSRAIDALAAYAEAGSLAHTVLTSSAPGSTPNSVPAEPPPTLTPDATSPTGPAAEPGNPVPPGNNS